MANEHQSDGWVGPVVNRRRFLRYAAWSAAAAALPWAGCAGRPVVTQPTRRPDVLVLLADDQTFSTLHAINNPAVHTPHLDALAARGTAMTHAFNQGGWHGAICMSSRAMIATGRGLYRITEPHDPRAAGQLETERTLWPEHFRNAGYKTFGTGKWHNGNPSYKRCFTHGDAVFLGGMHPYSDENGVNGGPTTLGHEHPRLRHYDGATQTFEQYHGEAWSTDCFVNAAQAFITEHAPGDAPLFTYVSFTAPHDPHHAPPQYREMYPDSEIELPPNFIGVHPFDTGDMNVRDERMLPTPRDPGAIRSRIGDYYAMVTHIDARIGDLMQTLDALGRLDNTIVVFTADHGLAVGQHGLIGKQSMYDHSVRVPMLWAGPGVPRGKRCDELVYLHQLYATTCDLAGVAPPGGLDVPSLVPVMRGDAAGYPSIFAGYRDRQRMVRTKRHKLIRYPHNGEVQLFDMRADPWEMNDLAEVPDRHQLVLELDGMLRDWQRELGDPLGLEPLK